MTPSEHARAFLLFSYFQLRPDCTCPSQILDASVARAYRDASSRVLSVVEEEKDELKQKAAKQIKNAISSLVRDGTEYDAWHCGLCSRLVSLYDGKTKADAPAFSYGIAQKWVNMTMKYLYLFTGVFQNGHPFETAYGSTVTALEPALHVPVDGVVLRAAWKQAGPQKVCFPGNDKAPQSGPRALDQIKAWSKWRREDYIRFQESLGKAGLWNAASKDGAPRSPIDWECRIWAGTAGT